MTLERAPSVQSWLLLLLAVIFAGGLSFATVELPYLIDGLLQKTVTTPGIDSHVDEIGRLKTELFIAHHHIRLIGYICFALTVLLIIVGFATRKVGLAALGGLALMLPVFAQFASVMFFLSGLGVLNAMWLPVLDVPYELQSLGSIIRAPYDGIMWLFRQIGINAYWPLVYFCIGSGLLLFILGTYAWLAARARGQGVADFWIYRFSRHPQYLGWIIWSYGVYLLLMRGLYPRRSWGIDASLPWLLSTLVIVGVAMLEELNMRRRFGEGYEEYRRSAPFLLPLPAFVKSFFTLPSRVLFRKEQPEHKREVAAVMTLYGVLLMAASFFFYGGGAQRVAELVTPSARREAEIRAIATELEEEPNNRAKYFISLRLAAYGDAATDQFIALLQSEQEEVRDLSAVALGRIGAQRAVPALVAALQDPAEDVRRRAVRALGSIGDRSAIDAMLPLLDDSVGWVRSGAMRSLAELGAEQIIERAELWIQDPDARARVAIIESLGVLGSERALPLVMPRLGDESAWVRQSAAVALLQISSPEACDALGEVAREDQDWEVRLYAAEAAKRIQPPCP